MRFIFLQKQTNQNNNNKSKQKKRSNLLCCGGSRRRRNHDAPAIGTFVSKPPPPPKPPRRGPLRDAGCRPPVYFFDASSEKSVCTKTVARLRMPQKMSAMTVRLRRVGVSTSGRKTTTNTQQNYSLDGRHAERSVTLPSGLM